MDNLCLNWSSIYRGLLCYSVEVWKLLPIKSQANFTAAPLPGLSAQRGNREFTLMLIIFHMLVLIMSSLVFVWTCADPAHCTYMCKKVGREIGGYLSKYFRFMSNFYQGVAEQELERDIERSFILLIRGDKDMVRDILVTLGNCWNKVIILWIIFFLFWRTNIKILFVSLLIMFLTLGKLKRAQ